METKDIPIDLIVPDPDQPRKHFDEAELMALAENLKAVGQAIPIIVYPVEAEAAERGQQ